MHRTRLRAAILAAALAGLASGVSAAAAPHLVANINPTGSSLPSPGATTYRPHFTTVGSTLYFVANDGSHAKELWKVSGGAASLVANINPFDPAGGSDPDELTRVGNTLFFVASKPVSGPEVWKSNGTEQGTVIVKDIFATPPNQFGGSYPAHLTAVGSTLYFDADDGNHGRELWKSDGTPGGTKLVKDIRSGLPGVSFAGSVNGGGTLYFAATVGSQSGLWKSDGTKAGTKLVKPFPAVPTGLVASSGSGIYFVADDGTHGRELWKSNGSPSGTVMVRDTVAGATGAGPDQLTMVGPTLYFSVPAGLNQQLWKSNGTTSGTVKVTPQLFSFLGWFTPVGKKLVFSGDDGPHGKEPWISNGSAPGTHLIKDLYAPGNDPSGASRPQFLTNVSGVVYFQADAGQGHGELLWQTDGTPGGTALVGGNPDYLNPVYITNLGGTVYFGGTTGGTDAELYAN